MYKELLKLSEENPIRVTMCEKTSLSYAYTFNDNSVIYYELDGNVDVYNDLILPNANEYDNINDAIHSESAIHDENPYDFSNIDNSVSKEVSANKFVKALSTFNNFYDENNIHKEYRGIHIKDGKMFATNAFVMRIVETTVFDKDINMVIDFKPILEYMDINVNKIKTTGKSLWDTKKTKNENVKLSTYSKDGDDVLQIEYKGLTFVNHSLCKSELNFSFIEKASKNLDSSIKVYKKQLYNAVNNILGTPIKNSNKVKNALVFEQADGKTLSIYPYIKFEDGISYCVEYVNAQSNIKDKMITNGENLLNILKSIPDEVIEIKYNNETNISKISSTKSKEDYYAIFNV
tara:strand:- start:124 stop:1164 length:1041 start_codon:yes stop_codon:yes gene_type:complete